MRRKPRVIIDVTLAVRIPKVCALALTEGNGGIDDTVGGADARRDVPDIARKQGSEFRRVFCLHCSSCLLSLPPPSSPCFTARLINSAGAIGRCVLRRTLACSL